VRRRNVTIVVEATLTSKGCLISAADMKAALGVGPDTQLKWHVLLQGGVIVRAEDLSLLSLAGPVKASRHVAIEDMCP
jgi:hypothetical protein